MIILIIGGVWLYYFFYKKDLAKQQNENIVVLSENDIVLAQSKIVAINQQPDLARQSYTTKRIGLDKRVGKIITEYYYCSDICPDYGHVGLQYEGIINTDECNKINGVPILSGEPSPGQYLRCEIKPIE